MKMKLKLLAAAAALVSVGAHATDVNWAGHAPLEFNATFVNAGLFTDSYSFTIPGLSDLTSVTVSNNIPTMLNITGGTVSLYSGILGSGSLLSTYNFDGTTGSTPNTWASLSSGSYYYLVSGTATGAAGGFYSISSTVTPVPEPQTYALMLAGLAAVGGIASRRRNKR